MRVWVLALALLSAMPAVAARRVALVVGENRGLADDELLRFAEQDAMRVRDALVEVSGFAPADVVLLAGTDAKTLEAALDRLAAELQRSPSERLFVYVSSHASDEALHLQGEKLPLKELVDFVKHAATDVGVLVVDACRSGAVTRMKGLKSVGEAAPKQVRAENLEGRVFISASGADEYAQESEALQGSAFTHFWVAAMRGAADASGDGKVTLDEAYSWAWARTIESTFASRAGVQRPAYAVNLRGQGELVLSQPSAASSRLLLDVRAPGRWLVVAVASGALMADLEKGEGPLTLALPAGRYRLKLRATGGFLEREVEVPSTGLAVVRGADLEQVVPASVARKGEAEHVLVLSAGGALSSSLTAGIALQPGAEVKLRREAHLAGPLNQLTLAVSVRSARNGFSHTELELRAGVGHRFALSRMSLGVGLELGPVLMLQGALPDDSGRTSLGLSFGVSLEVRVRLAGPVEAFIGALGGGVLVRRVEGPAVTPRIGGALGLALRF